MKKVIQIVATGEGFMDYDKSREAWVLLKAFLRGAKGNRIFSMDGLDIALIKNGEITKDEVIERIGEIEFITAENFPIWDYEPKYFTNSVCYMIAMAIKEGYGRIELYGVRQAGLVEYMDQRKGAEFWVGYAMGKGIEVYINPPTSLLKNHRDAPYGYYENEAYKLETKKEGAVMRSLHLVHHLLGTRRLDDKR